MKLVLCALKDDLPTLTGALILIEYTALSALVYFPFARPITAPRVPYATFVPREQEAEDEEVVLGVDEGRPSLGWFVKQVLSVWDVLGVLDLPAGRRSAVSSDDGEIDDIYYHISVLLTGKSRFQTAAPPAAKKREKLGGGGDDTRV